MQGHTVLQIERNNDKKTGMITKPRVNGMETKTKTKELVWSRILGHR